MLSETSHSASSVSLFMARFKVFVHNFSDSVLHTGNSIVVVRGGAIHRKFQVIILQFQSRTPLSYKSEVLHLLAGNTKKMI